MLFSYEHICSFKYCWNRWDRCLVVNIIKKVRLMFILCILNYIKLFYYERERGSIVGWGTMLQVGRSPVRVPDFQLTALRPWSPLSLYQKWVQGIFLGIERGRRIGLTVFPPSVSRISENVVASNSRNLKGLMACTEIALTCTLLFYYVTVSSSNKID
jgi:hypothetical protein